MPPLTLRAHKMIPGMVECDSRDGSPRQYSTSPMFVWQLICFQYCYLEPKEVYARKGTMNATRRHDFSGRQKRACIEHGHTFLPLSFLFFLFIPFTFGLSPLVSVIISTL